MGWTIKQIADKTGITVDTLRYYDKLGLVSPPRCDNGYRYYDEKNLSDLQYITVMKYAHFSLSQIKVMIGLFGNDPSAECNEVSRDVLNAKVKELGQMVLNYQKIIKLMEELLPMVDSIDAYCENEEQIDGFVKQIYDDIQQGTLFPADSALQQ